MHIILLVTVIHVPWKQFIIQVGELLVGACCEIYLFVCGDLVDGYVLEMPTLVSR